VRSRRVSSIHASIGRVSRRSEISSTGDGLAMGRSISWLCGVGLATHWLVLAFVGEAFLGSADTWPRLLPPGLFTGACQWSLFRGFNDFSRIVFGNGSMLGLGNTTPSEHVAPAISEAPLFRGRLRTSGRHPDTSGGCAASHYRPRRCPAGRGRLCVLPLPAAPVVGGVVTPAAAAFKLLFGGGALT
jgi:hypothetical protein